MLLIFVTTSAAYLVVKLPAPLAPRHAPRATRWAAPAMTDNDTDRDDGDDGELARAFSDEVSRRQPSSDAVRKKASPPFTGIREIVLDSAGRPTSIPRRPAPLPSGSAAGALNDLVRTPAFALGTFSLVSVAVLLGWIASADSAASTALH